MKKFEELNHYEALEVPMNASYFEIRHAYKEGLSIYDEDSVISNSFFADEERDKILGKIEEAYLTLIDDGKRAEYDGMLVDAGIADTSIFAKKDQKKPIALFRTKGSSDDHAFLKRVTKRIEEKDVAEMSKEVLSKELISGEDLKRLRESIGITLEEVFEVARIAVAVLRAIEEDQFERLPPMTYLKGFLKSYADLLQIDSKKIVDGYTRNVALTQTEG